MSNSEALVTQDFVVNVVRKEVLDTNCTTRRFWIPPLPSFVRYALVWHGLKSVFAFWCTGVGPALGRSIRSLTIIVGYGM